MLVPAFVLTQTAHWFFTGFIQEILFLKLLLGLIEGGGSFRQYALLVLLFALAGLLAKGTDCLTDYFVCTRMKHFYKNMNDRIFRKAVQVDMECYENPEFYDKYKRATEIVANDHFLEFTYNFANVFAGGITGIFLVVYVVSIDYRLLLILLFAIAVAIAGAIKGKLEVEKDREMTPHKRSKEYVKRTVFLKDFAKDMRTSGIYEVMHSRFRTAVEKNREIIKNYGIKMMLLELIGGFFGRALPVVSAYAYAAYRFVVKRNLAISDFSVIVTAVSNLKDVLNDLSEAISCMRKESEYFGNLREFMEYESKVVGGDKIADELETLEFRDVYFTYPGAEKPSLSGLSFKINKGETVAVVGKNGAGKTTLTNLLLRLYDVKSGSIKIGGRDIREETVMSHRARFAAVFQDFQLFGATVGENVALTSEYDSERVLEALRLAGFEKALPNGADTVLLKEFDENGLMLSGGEQQKLAIARVFYKQCPYIILDEPSANLDPVSEYELNKAISEGCEDRTVVFISHRLSTTRHADRILMLENGRIVECGSHDELMEKNGKYAYMFRLQAEKYN